MQKAFERLKQEMKEEMELAYPDYSGGADSLELWVDASSYGAGAYLAQVQEGKTPNYRVCINDIHRHPTGIFNI